MALDDESSELLAKYGFYLVVLIFWLIYRNRLGYIYFDRASFYSCLVIMLFWLGEGVFYTWRYSSPYFIANGVAGSISDRPNIVGDWAIFGLDGILSHGFHFRGKKRSVIVPVDSLQKFGRNWVSCVRVEYAEIGELPEEVENTIETEYFSNKCVFVGWIPETYQMEFPDAKQMEDELKQSYDRISELKKLLKGKFDVVEDAVGFGKRLGQGKKSILDHLKLTDKDKEE